MYLLKLFIFSIIHCIVTPLLQVKQHHELFVSLLKRDFYTRTSGTLFGVAWLILQPALQIAALWFLFQVILQVRFPGIESFINYFLLGMIPWLAITEIIMRSTNLYPEFASLFKRNAFPIIILPLLNICLTMIIYTVVYVLCVGILEGTDKMFPALLIMLTLALFMLPVSIIISVLSVFFKDIAQALPFILTMGLYLSPILYAPQMIPAEYQHYLIFNPVADFMALIHFNLQQLPPVVDGFMTRLLLEWLLLLAPAWLLFNRAEKHIREVL